MEEDTLTRKDSAMNAFRNKLLSGAEMVGFEIDLCDPCISEMVGQMGYDYLWIDTEHEAMDYQTVLMHIIAARAAGTASVVRIPQNEPFLAKRVLEMGPDGIIFPMISTAEEARRAMDACLYPPAGTRGFGPRRACRYGRQALPDYIKGAEDVTARLCQIESVTAVRNLDELLTVPGVDGFILGPCDLSGTVGHLNDIFHPDVLALVDEVIAKCRTAGKPIGIAVGADSAEDVRFWHDRGVQFISAGSDIATLVQHSRRQYDMMRSIFGNQ